MTKSEGIIRKSVPQSVPEAMDRLQAAVEKNGGTIYARINQQNELKRAGITIPPMEFLLFGNPAVGGTIILENPVAALDLPLKVIAWEDDQQQVWVAYNDGGYLQERHGLTPDQGLPLGLDKLLEKALNQ